MTAQASNVRGRAYVAARGAACLAGLAWLTACAGHNPPVASAPAPTLSPPQEAAIYKSHAKQDYSPPGPPSDPWGPYVTEASHRFDVPEAWIREVMNVESGGYEFRGNGELTTSPVGAMGLMQLMPETYDEMRARYGLTEDAFDPHNNILAGTAYLREMYDAFGSPAFLAAYNAGPNRLGDYLEHNRPLPDETRRYVWLIGTRITGVWPQNRSPNEQLAVNQIPVNIPAGPRYARHTMYAMAHTRRGHDLAGHSAPVRYAALLRHRVTPAPSETPVEVADAPDPRPAHATHAVATHFASATPPHAGGLHLITPALAADGLHFGGKDWAVQIGAYASRSQAASAAGSARASVAHANAAVASVQTGRAVLYRARLSGLTHGDAVHACQKLAHRGGGCLIVSPASQ
jgi:hypothetical protein